MRSNFLPLFLLSLISGVAVSIPSTTMAAPPPKKTAASENVVVAIRYLQVEGVSHAHLYLYRRDGKLVRQLTADNAGQDHDPVFAPDGGEVVYQRTNNGKDQWRAVKVSGEGDRALGNPPAWYEKQSPIPAQFTFSESVPTKSGGMRLSIAAKAGDLTWKSADAGIELVLKDDGERRDPDDEDWFPKKAWLRENGKDTCIETFPVFSPKRANKKAEFWEGPLPPGIVPNEERKDEEVRPEGIVAQTLLFCKNSPFLETTEIRAAFFTQHRGSTDGVGLFAVDLKGRHIFEMSPNGGSLYVLPEFAACACVCGQRYLPLGDGQRTVNCSYLDLWDAKMQRIRFANAKPAVCYGAAIFIAGENPVSVRIPREESEFP